MNGKAPTTEDRFRALAHGDFESVDVSPELRDGAFGGSGLDVETCQLVEISLEKILGTVIAVAPVVGSAKIVSACAKIVRAAALGEEFGVLAEG